MIGRLGVLSSALFVVLVSELSWYEVRPPGRGCWPPACASDELPLALRVVAHSGRLLMIGDGADPTGVYESSDGRVWRRSEHNAAWGVRYGAAIASYRGTLWVAGGFEQIGERRTPKNDVWRSRDGRRWERVLNEAPWQARSQAHLVVFRDTLWLIGGEPNDRVAWRTTDGLSWRSRRWSELPGANPQAVLVHRGALWILGHGAWDNATNDVWSSADGRSWIKIVPAASWPARTGAGFADFQDRLWVFAGAGRRDVWSSADGINWRQSSDSLPGPPRAANYSAVFEDRFCVFGGKTGGLGGSGFWDGVWCLH